MNILSNNLTTTCEVLVMLNSASNRLTVSFTEQYKDILTQNYRIVGEICHPKMEKQKTINYNLRHSIIQKPEYINHIELEIKRNNK